MPGLISSAILLLLNPGGVLANTPTEGEGEWWNLVAVRYLTKQKAVHEKKFHNGRYNDNTEKMVSRFE